MATHLTAAWRGVNRSMEPYLLPPGQLADALNVQARILDLDKRPGFAIIHRLDAVESNFSVYWPMSLPELSGLGILSRMAIFHPSPDHDTLTPVLDYAP